MFVIIYLLGFNHIRGIIDNNPEICDLLCNTTKCAWSWYFNYIKKIYNSYGFSSKPNHIIISNYYSCSERFAHLMTGVFRRRPLPRDHWTPSGLSLKVRNISKTSTANNETSHRDYSAKSSDLKSTQVCGQTSVFQAASTVPNHRNNQPILYILYSIHVMLYVLIQAIFEQLYSWLT